MWGLCPGPHPQNLAQGVIPRIRPPVLDFFEGQVCVQDPYLQGLGKRGPVPQTPVSQASARWGPVLDPHPGPPSPVLAPSLHPGAAAASHPPPHQQRRRPPPESPLSRPSHAGRRAAGHPGPGRPRLPRPRLGPDPRALLLLWRRRRRRQLGLTRAGAGGRGMVRDARARACSAPPRIPFRGRGSAPPASAPRPSPAHWPAACGICKKNPAPARRLAGSSSTPWPAGHAYTQIWPRLLRCGHRPATPIGQSLAEPACEPR